MTPDDVALARRIAEAGPGITIPPDLLAECASAQPPTGIRTTPHPVPPHDTRPDPRKEDPVSTATPVKHQARKPGDPTYEAGKCAECRRPIPARGERSHTNWHRAARSLSLHRETPSS